MIRKTTKQKCMLFAGVILLTFFFSVFGLGFLKTQALPIVDYTELEDMEYAVSQTKTNYAGLVNADEFKNLDTLLEKYKADPKNSTKKNLFDEIEGIKDKAKAFELFNFQIISDPHMSMTGSQEETLYGNTQQNFIDAMEFISYQFPDTSGLIVPGDVTCNGQDEEYNKYYEALANSPLPAIYTTVGNHEYNGYQNDKLLGREKFINTMNKYYNKAKLSSVDKVYFDTYIENYHFIFLGSEGYFSEWTEAIISDEQIEWFEKKLTETDPDQPIFVFLHQPLDNTVYLSDKWGAGGAESGQSERLKTILKKYPQVILSSGHIHNGLIGRNAIFNEGYGSLVDLPAFQYNDIKNQTIDIGYTVSVFQDRVVFTPINFDNETYMFEGALCLTTNESEKLSDGYDLKSEITKTSDSVILSFSEPTNVDGLRISNQAAITDYEILYSVDGSHYMSFTNYDKREGSQFKIHFKEKLQVKCMKFVSKQLPETIRATSYGVDKSALRKLYFENKSYQKNDYTEENQQRIDAFIEQALHIIHNTASTQSEVDRAAENLESALKEKSNNEGDNNNDNDNKNPSSSCASASCASGAASLLVVFPLMAIVPILFKRNIQ